VRLGALAATALAACGDEEAQKLSFTLTSPGVFSAPQSAEAGEAEITLTNSSMAEGR
jgi:hypothetical protein